VTASAYAANQEANLTNLPARWRTGRGEAPPVQRTDVPKEDGRQRPMGLPAFEDKLIQRAEAMLLGAIDEPDVHECSYGFREGRSPHHALHVWRERCMPEHSGGIVDAEVRACFDRLDHDWLCEGLTQRVQDGASLRLIRKWLQVGVLAEDTLRYPERGSPQGGERSPLLANVWLAHVLDAWFAREVKPRLRGRCFLLRFADNLVLGCAREDDARRIRAVMPKCVARFQLTIHPPKTRLVAFQPPRQPDGGVRGDGTCDCLGQPHDWTRERRGYWVIKRRPAKKRLRRAMRAVWHWGRTPRHDPWRAQDRQLCQKLRGYDQDDGIRGNDRKREAC
jgi:group II intron reverse transcriptase/maturase